MPPSWNSTPTPDATFREFHQGNKIGIDILAPKTDAEGAWNAPAPASAAIKRRHRF